MPAKPKTDDQSPEVKETQEEPKVETPKSDKPVRTFKLLAGVHYDDDGKHVPTDDTAIVKSTEDMVAKHGDDRFIELK